MKRVLRIIVIVFTILCDIVCLNILYNNENVNKIFNEVEVFKEKYVFNMETIYLPLEGKKDIKLVDTEDYKFYIEDTEVAELSEGIIIAKNKGTTKLKEKSSDSSVDVIVTDLFNKYYVSEKKKETVPCHGYTEEETKMLDDILRIQVKEAGYASRAGVVQAGRFLTLEFPYRIPYFYENGRLAESGTHYVDGEGRYYHEGLYLSDEKFEGLVANHKGPAAWGCPLTNLQNDPKHGYTPGKKLPNGLDCSGFVTWAFKNGGMDPGDIGAGETEGVYQMTDTGKFTPLTQDIVKQDIIKAGDLFNFWGHIALIIGVDDENYYVAESLPYLKGVVAKVYKKTKVTDRFEFVVFMDDFYKNEGNYTAMWE